MVQLTQACSNGDVSNDYEALRYLLAQAGFIAADEEADELLACAAGDGDRLREIVHRRLNGEPLAWITGSISFCGLEVRIAPGVYVPRWQSEPLARRAVERLPANGVAIDLCTGAGAIAKVLASERPKARVVASDLDERSCACAAANGVEVCRGDLFGPLPRALEGHVDLVVGVVPYVPTRALRFWPVTPWSSRHLCRTTAVPTEPTSSDESWRTARSSCAKEVRSSSNWAAIRPTLSSPT